MGVFAENRIESAAAFRPQDLMLVMFTYRSNAIGENDPATRAEVAAGCGWLGLALDGSRNGARAGVISSDASRVKVLVVPTDEERMIARYTARALTI